MPGIQIIGIGGFLGKTLFSYFGKKQTILLGTSHQRHLTDSKKTFFLDLLNPDFKFLSPTASGLQFSILCSSETNIDKCKTESAISDVLNVTNTIKLIENLWINEITPVFISSDSVFNGKVGSYIEEDICNPITQYGRQKRCVEKFLIESNKPWLIVRLCKVFDVKYEDNTLITSWLDSLRVGDSIKCANDQFISPTYVVDVCKSIESLIDGGKTGIYHVCSPETFSRFSLGIKVAKYFQIDQNKVKKCSISDFNFIEPRSMYNTLNPQKLIFELNTSFCSMESCLENIFSNYKD